MFNWIKKLFGKKKVEVTPLPDPQPTELIIYNPIKWIKFLNKINQLNRIFLFTFQNFLD